MSNVNAFQKPKIDRTKYILNDKKDDTLIKKKGDIEGFNFKMRNLTNCKVYLLDWTTGIFVDDCVNCDILIGPCDGSVFIRTSKNCRISVISKQLRFRECHDCIIYSYCPSDPVVEASSNVIFAPFNYLFPNANFLFKKANFNERENNYTHVYDFSENDKKDKLHWRLIEIGEFEEQHLTLDGIDEPNEQIYEDYEKEYQNLVVKKEENKIKEKDKKSDYTYSFIEEDINVSELIDENDLIINSNTSKNASQKNKEIVESLKETNKIFSENERVSDDNQRRKKEFFDAANERFANIIGKKIGLKNTMKNYLEKIKEENSYCEKIFSEYKSKINESDYKKKMKSFMNSPYGENLNNYNKLSEEELTKRKNEIMKKYIKHF